MGKLSGLILILNIETGGQVPFTLGDALEALDGISKGAADSKGDGKGYGQDHEKKKGPGNSGHNETAL